MVIDQGMRQRQLPQEVYLWLQSLDLSYAIRSVKRDFANGFLVAEAFSRYFPNLVSVHGYQNGNSVSCKSANWYQLQRVFKRVQFEVDTQLISEIIHCKNGAICSFLEESYEFLSGRTIKREVASSGDNRDDIPSFARDTASRVIHNYLKEPSVQAITDVKIRAQKTEEVLKEHKSRIDASRSERSKLSGSSVMSQEHPQDGSTARTATRATSTSASAINSHPVAAASHRDSTIIVKNVTVKQITTNIAQVRASKEMSGSLYSVKTGSLSQSESKHSHPDDAGLPQARAANIINNGILSHMDQEELTDGTSEPMFRLISVLNAQAESPETELDEDSLRMALEEVGTGLAHAGLGANPDAMWLISTFFLQLLHVLDVENAAFKACEKAWIRFANAARHASHSATFEGMINVVWPKLLRVLQREQSPKKMESLLRVAYAFTSAEQHVEVIKALHKAVELDRFIALLSLLAPEEDFQGQNEDHLLDLFLYYALRGMESPASSTQEAGTRILLALAKDHPAASAAGMEMAMKLMRRPGTRALVKEQIVRVACLLLQGGIHEGIVDALQDMMEGAESVEEKKTVLVHVGTVVTDHSDILPSFIQLLFKFFQSHQGAASANNGLEAGRDAILRKWNSALIARQVVSAMEQSEDGFVEAWQLALFFFCLRQAASLDVAEWEEIFDDTKQILFSSLAVDALQEHAADCLLFWMMHASYHQRMLTDPLLSQMLEGVFHVDASLEDRAAHAGVFAFFEHLITNSSKSVRPTLVSHDLQSQQYKQDVSTVACDVLRQFIEAHAGHVQVHPALAELEKLVN